MEKTDEILEKCVRKITMASPAAFVACTDSTGEGITTAASGGYYEIISLIAAAILRFSQESDVELEELGNDLNHAVKFIKKEWEEAEV